MKNTPFLIISLFLLAGQASAQWRLGIKAGFTAATGNSIYTPGGQPSIVEYSGGKARPTFHAGVVADVPLTRFLYLQPGLQYTGRGERGRIDVDMPVEPGLSNWVTSTRSRRLHTIELPVNLLAKFTVGKGRLFGGGGPSFGYGVSGDVKEVYKGKPREVKKMDISFGNGENDTRRFFVGVNAAAGYEFSQRWMAAVSYNHAIVSAEYGSTFGVSAGYFFRK